MKYKYLAIAEIDTSGTVIQSNIRIISIEMTKTDPSNIRTETTAAYKRKRFGTRKEIL